MNGFGGFAEAFLLLRVDDAGGLRQSPIYGTCANSK